MVTIKNYFSVIKYFEDELPGALAKGHRLVVEATKEGTNLESYKHNGIISEAIDRHLALLNKYITSKKKSQKEAYTQQEPLTQEKPTTKKDKPRRKSESPAAPSSKPASESRPRKVKSQKSTAKGKQVEQIRDEVKFIRRFVGLNNRVKSPSSVLSLLKGLQRAIVQKQIKKTSPFADDIRYIQDKLIFLVKRMDKHMQIDIQDKELERLVKVAGGEQVYPSINIMKRYISLSGRPAEADKIERFAKQIEKALESEKVGSEDPYREKVKVILNTLDRMKHGSIVQIAETELNGLEGIVSRCSCGEKTHPVNGLSGVLTAEEMATRTLDLLQFTSIWLQLLGCPARNFTLMLHGEPYNGKTIVLLKLAQYLAENFGNVLYISSEEYSSPTMTKKVNAFVNPRPERLHFAENFDEPVLSDYQFIIIDSVNDLGLKLADFKTMRKQYPDTAFVFVLQHTKAGDFRGGKDWEHAAEIVAEVTEGVIQTTKNRYAPKNIIDFFKRLNIQWEPHHYSIQNHNL